MGSKGVVSTNDAFSIPAEWIDEDFVMPTDLKERGGPGSGHHGHKGRPGKVGGSLPREAGEVFEGIPDTLSIWDQMGMPIIFSFDPARVDDAIKDIETKLRNKAKHAEFYYVFNPKTGEGVAHSSGWPEAVFFSPDIDDYIRGLGENNISIHNHPGRNDQTNKEDVPPSLTDINLVTTHKVGEVRIVGESMTMVVTIKKFDTAFFHEVMKPAFRQYSQDHVTDYIPDFFDVPPTEIDVGGFPNAEYQRMRLRTDSSYAEQVSIYQRAQWRWFANEFSEHFDYKEIPYDDSD